MAWVDVSEVNRPYHEFAWGFRDADNYSVFVYRTLGVGMRMQWKVDGSFTDPRKAPDDLEEAKALALVLYRMGG